MLHFIENQLTINIERGGGRGQFVRKWGKQRWLFGNYLLKNNYF